MTLNFEESEKVCVVIDLRHAVSPACLAEVIANQMRACSGAQENAKVGTLLLQLFAI